MSDQGEQEVEIRRISDPEVDSLKESFGVHRVGVDPVCEVAAPPGEKVRIRFENFVNLVATHNFQHVVNKHRDEEVIVSTNLLADLANAHEDKEEKKLPVIFAIGLIAGIILTYILFRY